MGLSPGDKKTILKTHTLALTFFVSLGMVRVEVVAYLFPAPESF